MTSTSIYTSAIPVIQSKICNKCNELKLAEEFSKSKETKDGLQRKCKACNKKYAHLNKDHAKEYVLKNKERTATHRSLYQKDYRKANEIALKESERIRGKIYREENRGLVNANSAKYKAAKLKAIPKWAELDLISQLYEDCKLISEMTGIEHHVDHIIPLQSEIVCGLHCFDNLQIISATDNLSKSNSYWPDMP